MFCGSWIKFWACWENDWTITENAHSCGDNDVFWDETGKKLVLRDKQFTETSNSTGQRRNSLAGTTHFFPTGGLYTAHEICSATYTKSKDICEPTEAKSFSYEPKSFSVLKLFFHNSSFKANTKSRLSHNPFFSWQIWIRTVKACYIWQTRRHLKTHYGKLPPTFRNLIWEHFYIDQQTLNP